ncbi:MAG: hypothetical protein IJ422_00070, partial [Oscillospiraceae bacterium]|nr:hypothetical protein [Oscillospiraceae bacterium]
MVVFMHTPPSSNIRVDIIEHLFGNVNILAFGNDSIANKMSQITTPLAYSTLPQKPVESCCPVHRFSAVLQSSGI